MLSRGRSSLVYDQGGRQGTGLSQLYGYVKQSGGNVKIYSEPGTGTTIKIYLPRSHDPLAPTVDAPVGDVPDAQPHERVLLVEDDDNVRNLSAEALALLELHPQIGLLLTDIVMPDMNGRVLADRVLARRPELPVLFTSGYTRNAIVSDGTIDAGVWFLAKPFSVEQLGLRVRAVLDAASR